MRAATRWSSHEPLIPVRLIRSPATPGSHTLQFHLLQITYLWQQNEFQVFISYGLLFGLGAATVRDTSSMMVSELID